MEERVGSGKVAFVVNDRRGEKKAPREPEGGSIALSEVEASKDKSSWKEVAFMTAPAQVNDMVVILLRAVGLRSDGRPFIADWIMAPFLSEEASIDEWKGYVRKRLDTFLNCACTEGGNICSDHRRLLDQWKTQDMDRFIRITREPVPEVLEVYFRFEQSRQKQSIVAPR